MNFNPLVGVLVGLSDNESSEIRETAVEWLGNFVKIGREVLAPVYEKIVFALLARISDKSVSERCRRSK